MNIKEDGISPNAGRLLWAGFVAILFRLVTLQVLEAADLSQKADPDIVRAFMQLNKVVLYEGTVSEELKMLVSLIASQTAGCRE